MDALLEYEWPGNVRELEHVLQQMIAMNSGPWLNGADLPSFVLNRSLERQCRPTRNDTPSEVSSLVARVPLGSSVGRSGKTSHPRSHPLHARATALSPLLFSASAAPRSIANSKSTECKRSRPYQSHVLAGDATSSCHTGHRANRPRRHVRRRSESHRRRYLFATHPRRTRHGLSGRSVPSLRPVSPLPQEPLSKARCCLWPRTFAIRLLQPPLPILSADLFHALNQRVDRRPSPRVVTTFHDLFVLTAEYSTADFRKRFADQAKRAATNFRPHHRCLRLHGQPGIFFARRRAWRGSGSFLMGRPSSHRRRVSGAPRESHPHRRRFAETKEHATAHRGV